MKRSIYILGGLLCLFFTACNASGQSSSDEILIEETMQEKLPSDETQHDEMSSVEEPFTEEPPAEEPFTEEPPVEEFSGQKAEAWEGEKPAYVEAYTAFLLDENTDRGHDFPIRGYYLFDLNFDDIPELGILHDSWGSMGGYFTIYYFDGKDVTAVLNDRGEPAGISNYTQILADFEQKKVYFLKEMYLLVGNNNGTYGYVREVKSEGGVPCVYDILNLEVDWESDMGSLIEISLGKDYIGEDTFLSDPELEDYLITQRYVEKEWMDISLSEYLRQKRELIPEGSSFVDLRNLDMNYLGVNYDEDGFYTDVRMEKEEIEQLFRRYVESLQNTQG